jgi:hypothetical protein
VIGVSFPSPSDENPTQTPVARTTVITTGKATDRRVLRRGKVLALFWAWPLEEESLRYPGLREVDEWVGRLGSAQRAGRLDEELERLRRIPLVLFDEIGYIPFDPEAAALFFALVSSRYERASIIVNSNKTFSSWAEIFGVKGGRMPSPPRRDMPASRFRDHGSRANPVGDLGVTKLKVDVAKGNVPEQRCAIGSRDRPTGVSLSAPPLMPCPDPGERLFFRIEPSHVPLLDAWLVKRDHHARSVSPCPRTQRDGAFCPEHGLLMFGHAASGDNRRGETWHEGILSSTEGTMHDPFRRLDEQIPRTTFLLRSGSEDPHSQAPRVRYLVPLPSRSCLSVSRFAPTASRMRPDTIGAASLLMPCASRSAPLVRRVLPSISSSS